MSHFKNKEIALRYNISTMTVSRWIASSKERKNDLELVKVGSKTYIVDNKHNEAVMKRLSEQGKINKPSSNFQRVEPHKDFYSIFSQSQILNIINSLETKSTIGLKYNYMERGAEIWDSYYIQNGVLGDSYPTPKREIELLKSNQTFFKGLSRDYSKINVFDIGPGNSLPVVDFLKKLEQEGKLNKYIIVDISREMLEIAERNIRKEFPTLEIKKYVTDVEISNIDTIFFENSEDHDVYQDMNIILYLGSTIGNTPEPSRVLSNFREGMRKQDVLVISNTADSIQNKLTFNSVKQQDEEDISTWIPSMLGIEVGKCDLISKYDEIDDKRKLNLKSDKNYEINFQVLGKTKTVKISKGQEINIWFHQMTKQDRYYNRLQQAELFPVNITYNQDQSYMMSMSMVKGS